MGRNKKWTKPTYEIVDGNGKQTKCYSTWNYMMTRCYNIEYQEKYPTYKGCSVSEEWKDFDNFYDWFQENYKEGFQLDKDILQQNNKVYGPDTCCFVPQSINSLFTKHDSKRGEQPLGVCFHKHTNKYLAQCSNGKGAQVHLGVFTDHLEAHEAYCRYKYQLIREIGLEALKNGDIDERIYNAMLNYKIPIF